MSVTLNMAGVVAKFESHVRHVAQRVHDEGDTATQAQMTDIRNVIIETSPVDTGALRAHWSPLTRYDDLVWGVSNDRIYAPVLEYGGYHRVGKKTVRAGPAPIGEDFVANQGIYSTQAPLGWVRYALVRAKPQYVQRIQTVLRRAWGTGGEGTTLTTERTSRLPLTSGQIESLFDITLDERR